MNIELENKNLTSNTVLVEVEKCQNCNINNAQDKHTCPYKEDIHADYNSLCNCCSECEHECCMDI